MALKAIQRKTHISTSIMPSNKPYRNVVGLSQVKLDELLRTSRSSRNLAKTSDRVVRYVLDGDDEVGAGRAGRQDRRGTRPGIAVLIATWF